MVGYIRSRNSFSVGEHRVGSSLRRLFPNQHRQRLNFARRATNPIPYRADYFGHKLHVDQNEKLVMYGVTHVAAIDGHSRFVVAAHTMPIKNNCLIYEHVYRYDLQ